MPSISEVFPGVYHFPLGYVNAYMLAEDDGLTLIDSGLRGHEKRIVRGMRETGRSPKDLRRILVTHHHADHVGALAALKKASGAEAYVHELDAPVVSGEKRRPGPNPASIFGRVAGPVLTRLPANNPPPSPVEHLIGDGDELPMAGGVTVLHTPGHTAGHVSFLLPSRGGVLFAGDAAAHLFGRLGKPALVFTEDMAQVRASMRKLAALEFDTACFGHGGVVKGRAHAEFRRYIEKMAR